MTPLGDGVRILLQEKGAIDIKDAVGMGPLHYAAAFGNNDMLALVADAYPHLNPTDERGRTPLMMAAYFGNSSNLPELVRRGARADLLDKYKCTVLHHAVDQTNKPAVEWILENVTKIDLDAHDSLNRTPLSICEQFGETNPTALDIKGLLLQHGATPLTGHSRRI